MQDRIDAVRQLGPGGHILERLRAPARPRSISRGKLLAPLCILAVAVAAAGVATRVPRYLLNEDELAQMANTVIESLCANRLAEPPAICAESPRGQALLREEDRRAGNGAGTSLTPEVRVPCHDFLAAAREGLTQQGVNWERVRPLAFSGVRAKLIDRARMRRYTISVIGEIYFADGGTVYSLELSARRCNGTYVVTDFWKCSPVDAAPGALEQHGRLRYQAYKRERAESGERVKVKSERHVFVDL